MSSLTGRRILSNLAVIAITQVSMYFIVHLLLDAVDPERKKRRQQTSATRLLLRDLGVKNDMSLNEHELQVCGDMVDKTSIDASWSSIGGLDGVIDQLKELVVLPFERPDLFNGGSSLLQPPKGILFYGPPGCGKTMLARAVAKESGCLFIELKVSTLMDKYYGESQKLCAALFSLAEKLAPVIIFIDEIDSFLRERQKSDHEISAIMKAQFMSLWDGLSTSPDARILIIGATNRPHDVDEAILRRLPRKFHIPVPNIVQRESILHVILRDEKLSDDFDYAPIAKETQGYTGNDLRELARSAAMRPVREMLGDSDRSACGSSELRPLCTADLLAAKASGRAGAVVNSVISDWVGEGDVVNRTISEDPLE